MRVAVKFFDGNWLVSGAFLRSASTGSERLGICGFVLYVRRILLGITFKVKRGRLWAITLSA